MRSRLFLGYALIAFVLPGLIHIFAGPLPFVHYTSFGGRLAVAAIVGLAICGLEFSNLRRTVIGDTDIPGDPVGDPLGQLKRGTCLLLGMCMFIWVSADYSSNIFGSASHLLPSTAYQETVEVERSWLEDHSRRGSSKQWLRLELRNKSNGKPMYLELSPRILKVPYLQTGDVVHLSGWQTLLGPYVTQVKAEKAGIDLPEDEKE
ncbi:MAG TPA: hypothetical protein VL381_07260 [Rhodocyclaceae bacterium]|nr:hypothetical protein [Rhodocyclaceae bacterium]